MSVQLSVDKVDLIIKDLCSELALDFPEYFRIAFNEQDSSKEVCLDANEFLKMDEVRLGRDFKLYGFMASVSSFEGAIADFADVLMWIKQKHPKAFESIRERVESWSVFFLTKKCSEVGLNYGAKNHEHTIAKQRQVNRIAEHLR